MEQLHSLHASECRYIYVLFSALHGIDLIRLSSLSVSTTPGNLSLETEGVYSHVMCIARTVCLNLGLSRQQRVPLKWFLFSAKNACEVFILWLYNCWCFLGSLEVLLSFFPALTQLLPSLHTCYCISWNRNGLERCSTLVVHAIFLQYTPDDK